MIPINQITYKDAQNLRRKPVGTAGKSIVLSKTEVEQTHKQLEKIYIGHVTLAFAEKIALRNRIY